MFRNDIRKEPETPLFENPNLHEFLFENWFISKSQEVKFPISFQYIVVLILKYNKIQNIMKIGRRGREGIKLGTI